jgi:hypothetical protein
LSIYNVLTKRIANSIITIFRYITYLPKGQHTPLSPSSGILRTYQKENTPNYHHLPVYYVFTKRKTHPIITNFRYITYLPKGKHTQLSPSSGILRIYQKENTISHKAYITNLSYCSTMGPYYLCKAEIKNMPVTTIHVLSHEHLTPDMTLL